MKKRMALVSLGIALFSLAACGPKGNTTESGDTAGKSNKDYDLLVWEDQSKADGIADAVAAFEKEHDVTIKVVEKAYAQQIEDLRLDGPAGTGPDVITIPGDQIGTSVTEGLLKELDVDQATQDIYTESAMQSQIVDGKVYGLPKAVETQILFYNKDLIQESELPKTLGEWLTYSKKITDNEKDKYGLISTLDQIYYAEALCQVMVATSSVKMMTAATIQTI